MRVLDIIMNQISQILNLTHPWVIVRNIYNWKYHQFIHSLLIY